MISSGNIPFNAMGGRENVSVVDEHAAAIEPIEVAESGHPRELVNAGRLSAHNARRIVPFAASFCTHKTHDPQSMHLETPPYNTCS